MLRAGLTEVFVTGILTRCMIVNPSPIAIGANPAGAFGLVDPKMIIRKKNVITTSDVKAAVNEYPPGECSPYPFDAKPPSVEKPGAPLAIRYRTPAAAMAPNTCAMMYPGSSDDLNRPPTIRPIETAGLKCPPEM